MAKFAPRVTEEEIRSARRRIAAGDSKRSVARSLGYVGSSPHKALQQRIDAQERRDDCERLERQTRVATAEAEKKRIARGVRTGYGQVERTTEAPERGRTFEERYAATRDAIENAMVEEEMERQRKADRNQRYGFGSGRPMDERGWLDERDAQRDAAAAFALAHPEIEQRHGLYTFDGRWLASKPPGLTQSELDAWADRYRESHGLVELARETSRGVRA